MPYVYIVECSDGAYYTGSTWDLDKRLWEHNNGLGANFTRKRLPVRLVYCEFSDEVSVAYAREKQVQGWSRAKKRALIEGRWSDLPGLSRNPDRGLAPAALRRVHINQGRVLQNPSTSSGNGETSSGNDETGSVNRASVP